MKRVYFIKPIGMDGPVKIGCSSSPNGRRKALETWSPFPLEVVAEIDGDFGVERQFHVMFNDLARGREWFDISSELQTTIDAIKAGTFELDSLPIGGVVKDFRKPRDNSFCTPGWRYHRSVMHRVWRRKHIEYTPFMKQVWAIAGYGHNDDYAQWLANRDKIEALFENAARQAGIAA